MLNIYIWTFGSSSHECIQKGQRAHLNQGFKLWICEKNKVVLVIVVCYLHIVWSSLPSFFVNYLSLLVWIKSCILVSTPVYLKCLKKNSHKNYFVFCLFFDGFHTQLSITPQMFSPFRIVIKPGLVLFSQMFYILNCLFLKYYHFVLYSMSSCFSFLPKMSAEQHIS